MKQLPIATDAAPLELERFVPYRLSILASTMSAAIAAAYAERYALTIPEWRVLTVLAASPGASAAQVARCTAMDKVAVSRAVAVLVRERRVERGREESDRRRSRLQLTAAGLAVYREVVPFALAYEAALLRGLSRPSRLRLDALLDELLRRARGLRTARLPGSVEVLRSPAATQRRR